MGEQTAMKAVDTLSSFRKESAVPVDPRTRLTMGILGLLAAVLMVVSAYFAHRAGVQRTEAANLSDGTSLDPGLPMDVLWRLVAAVVFGAVSAVFLARGRQRSGKTQALLPGCNEP